jgi:hypothetical protein
MDVAPVEAEVGDDTVANMLWFGAWLFIIFGLHQSGWLILVPIIVHFKETKKGMQIDK